MPKSCGAPHCSNAAGQPRPPARRLSFYKFPLRDAARLRRWLAQMRRDDWLPTRHHHLCSEHFEPSCFQYRWGVRYLRPDAVPTIFPRGPPKRECPGAPPAATQPQRPSPSRGTEPAAAARPRDPETAAPQAAGAAVPPAPCSPPAPAAAAPETVPSAASPPPAVAAVPAASKAPPARELSTEELVGVALVLQRKVKVLQQRQRRHRARLEAMEELVEQLRRESLLCEERLQLACLQPDPAGALAVTCREEEEEEEEALLCAVPPPGGPHRGLERL